MSKITSSTTIEELAAIVSQALENSGIIATLSGGAAVSIYTENEYLSKDLDFVTSAAHKELNAALEPLGFNQSDNARMYRHSETEWFLEFPSGPLGFGDTTVDQEIIPILETNYGPIRIITPTLSLLDRLAACFHHTDSQCWDQARMLAKQETIDWQRVRKWLNDEKLSEELIEKLTRQEFTE